MPKKAPPSNTLTFLDDLRAHGVTRASFDYGPEGEQRLTSVEFAEVGPDDVRKALEQVEARFDAKLLDGLDGETREKVEQRLFERQHYHSS